MPQIKLYEVFDRGVSTGDFTSKEAAEQLGIPSYVTALDLCLQGIISPSTLGIDVKKLDNAEAQREKEKATLYTRNAIVEVLQEELPEVISACINAYYILLKQPVKEVKVEIPFEEYANPSFESQVETLSKARPGSPVMGIEALVEEMWGDSKDDEWKDEEVRRLKAEPGIMETYEPGLNTEGVTILESEGEEPPVQDEPSGVPGAPEGGK